MWRKEAIYPSAVLAVLLLAAVSVSGHPPNRFWPDWMRPFPNWPPFTNNHHNRRPWTTWTTWTDNDARNKQAKEQACQQLLADCKGMGNLTTRLRARVDTQGNPVAPVQELINNFDTNQDSCISRQEFQNVFRLRGFSEEYANDQYSVNLRNGIDSTTCPGSISVNALTEKPYISPPTVTRANDYNVRTLLQFCNAGDGSRYRTNCDCVQLPMACRSAPLSTTEVCNQIAKRWAYIRECPFSSPITNSTSTYIKIRCTNRDFVGPEVRLLNALCDMVSRTLPDK